MLYTRCNHLFLFRYNYRPFRIWTWFLSYMIKQDDQIIKNHIMIIDESYKGYILTVYIQYEVHNTYLYRNQQ